MYQKPAVTRFGTMRELTLAGCAGASDAVTVPGVGTSIGSEIEIVNGTTLVCFVGSS